MGRPEAPRPSGQTAVGQPAPRPATGWVDAAGCPLNDVALARTAPVPAPKEIAALVRTIAPRYGLNPDLVLAVIAAESGFRNDAVSAKGAAGLMQLIPGTAERFGVNNRFDPADNIQGGIKYLRWLLDYFQGNVVLSLAGYNAGEGSVLHYGGIPPYAETRAYVENITKRLRLPSSVSAPGASAIPLAPPRLPGR